MLLCYRLCFARSERRHEFAATSDAHAVGIALGVRQGRAAELWCGDRLVHRWQGRSPLLAGEVDDPGSDQLIIGTSDRSFID
jgi:hypothetical protein